MNTETATWEEALAHARRHPRPVATDISLVIPTVGRRSLAQTIGTVLAGSAWPASIVVSDQGEMPEIASWLADAETLGIECHYVRCGGRGRARGLNAGLRQVTTPFVVITDDDCIPENRWIERCAAYLLEEPGVVLTGRIGAAGAERILNTVSDERPSVARTPGLSYDRLSGGNCGMAIAVLRQAGLFDEDPCVSYAEDGEWAYRALRAGIPIHFAPDLFVAHVGWRDLQERVAQYRRYARSHAAFFGKHMRRGDLFITIRAMVHVARALKRWLRGAVRGDAELAENGRCYVTQFLPGLVAGISSRVQPPALT